MPKNWRNDALRLEFGKLSSNCICFVQFRPGKGVWPLCHQMINPKRGEGIFDEEQLELTVLKSMKSIVSEMK